VLEAMLSRPRCHKGALRVRDLVRPALDDFFLDDYLREDDTAALGQCFPDDIGNERVGDLLLEPPFPAA
jgi:hypothetical protein